MKNRLVTFLFLCCSTVLASAGTFNNDRYGYSIDVDDIFQLTRNDQATYFRSQDNSSVIIIKNWPGVDEGTVKKYLQQGYQDERVAIVSASEPKELDIENGRGFQVDTRGVFERRPAKGMAAGFIGNDGQGLLLMLAATEESWDKLAPVLQKTTSSVKFTAYRSGPSARDWYHLLSDSRLTSKASSGDKSRKESMNFCSDGIFRHRISTSAIGESDSGSAIGHSSKSRSGHWDIVDDGGKSRLMLFYNDGRRESAIIEDKDGQILLDGRPYHRLRKHPCRK